MIEFSNAIKSALNERAKKPFTGTFALAWIVINWKIWFTLLFVNEMRLGGLTKTEFIKNNYINYWDNLWTPIISAALLIFLIPLFNLGALFVKKCFDDFEFKKILKKTPVDGAQVALLLETQRNLKEEFTDRIKDLGVTNSNLETDILALNKEINDLEKDNEKYIGLIKISKKKEAQHNHDFNNVEDEYKTVAKIVSGYRDVVIELEKKSDLTSNTKTKLEVLNAIKIRGAYRISEIT